MFLENCSEEPSRLGGFKRQAKEWKALMDCFVPDPFALAHSEIAIGRTVPSFVSTILAAHDKLTQEEADLKWTVTSMYSTNRERHISYVRRCFHRSNIDNTDSN
jgi:3-phosphoglycerate kinase